MTRRRSPVLRAVGRRTDAGGEVTTTEMAITDTSPPRDSTRPRPDGAREPSAVPAPKRPRRHHRHRRPQDHRPALDRLLAAVRRDRRSRLSAWGQPRRPPPTRVQTRPRVPGLHPRPARPGVPASSCPLFIGIATVIVPLQVGASTIAFPRAAAAAFWTWLLVGGLLLRLLPAHRTAAASAAADAKGVRAHLPRPRSASSSSLLLATVCIVDHGHRPAHAGHGTSIGCRCSGGRWSSPAASGCSPAGASSATSLLDLRRPQVRRPGAVRRRRTGSGPSWPGSSPSRRSSPSPSRPSASPATSSPPSPGGRQPAPRRACCAPSALFGALASGPTRSAFFNPACTTSRSSSLQSAAHRAARAHPARRLRRGPAHAARPKFASPLLARRSSRILLLLLACARRRAVRHRPPRSAVHAQGRSPTATRRSGSRPAGSPIYTWGVLGCWSWAAATTGALAGLFYWAPKITGKRVDRRLGKLLAPGRRSSPPCWSVPPFLVLGLRQQGDESSPTAPTRLYGVSRRSARAILARSSCSSASRCASSGVPSAIGGAATADADAWGFGQTLEWATDTPPAPGNFGALADVTSPEPLLDLAEPEVSRLMAVTQTAGQPQRRSTAAPPAPPPVPGWSWSAPRSSSAGLPHVLRRR